MSTVNGALRAIYGELKTYLAANMSSFTTSKIKLGYPESGEDLELPSISIHALKPNFTPEIANTAKIGTITDHEADVFYRVGKIDVDLQLDVWVEHKFSRFKLWEELFQAFNPNLPVHGLGLTLTDYHDIICRYDLSETNFSDTEDQILSGQFKFTTIVRCHCDAVVAKTENTMTTIQPTAEVVDELEE